MQEQEKFRQETTTLNDSEDKAIDIGSEERKLRELELKQHKLLTENNTLKHNLAISEANVQNFVREMNTMLDQHDIGGLVGSMMIPEIDFGLEP